MKPLTRTEMKILIYNKTKRGVSYEEAREQVKRDIEQARKNHIETKEKSKEEKKSKTQQEKLIEGLKKN